MTVTAELVTAEFSQALVVSTTYVARDADSGHVFVLDNGRASGICKSDKRGRIRDDRASERPPGSCRRKFARLKLQSLSEESILLYPEKLSDGDRVEKQENGGN